MPVVQSRGLAGTTNGRYRPISGIALQPRPYGPRFWFIRGNNASYCDGGDRGDRKGRPDAFWGITPEGTPSPGVPTEIPVGNAVPGVPSAKFDLDGQILPQPHRIAAFGGTWMDDK